MTFRSVWDFVAGESRLAPIAVVLAIVVVLIIHSYLPNADHMAGAIFVAIIAGGLVAGVFEKA